MVLKASRRGDGIPLLKDLRQKEDGCPDKNQKYHHRQNEWKNFQPSDKFEEAEIETKPDEISL